MRSGTSSLFRWLTKHPAVGRPFRKEVHFFDIHFDRGVSWYRSFFPLKSRGLLAFDATPSYLAHPLAAERAVDLLPDAKLVAVLRDPVERAWSHYRYRRASGEENRPFEAVVNDTLANRGLQEEFRKVAEIGYLNAGNYAYQLSPWIERFGHDRLLVVDAHELFDREEVALRRVAGFLGLEPSSEPLSRVNEAPEDQPDAQLIEVLREYYEPSNRQLREEFGLTFGWLA